MRFWIFFLDASTRPVSDVSVFGFVGRHCRDWSNSATHAFRTGPRRRSDQTEMPPTVHVSWRRGPVNCDHDGHDSEHGTACVAARCALWPAEPPHVLPAKRSPRPPCEGFCSVVWLKALTHCVTPHWFPFPIKHNEPTRPATASITDGVPNGLAVAGSGFHNLQRKLLEETVPYGWNLATTNRSSQLATASFRRFDNC